LEERKRIKKFPWIDILWYDIWNQLLRRNFREGRLSYDLIQKKVHGNRVLLIVWWRFQCLWKYRSWLSRQYWSFNFMSTIDVYVYVEREASHQFGHALIYFLFHWRCLQIATFLSFLVGQINIAKRKPTVSRNLITELLVKRMISKG